MFIKATYLPFGEVRGFFALDEFSEVFFRFSSDFLDLLASDFLMIPKRLLGFLVTLGVGGVLGVADFFISLDFDSFLDQFGLVLLMALIVSFFDFFISDFCTFAFTDVFELSDFFSFFDGAFFDADFIGRLLFTSPAGRISSENTSSSYLEFHPL